MRTLCRARVLIVALVVVDVGLTVSRAGSDLVNRWVAPASTSEVPSPAFVARNLQFRYIELFTLRAGLMAEGFHTNGDGLRWTPQPGTTVKAYACRRLWLFGGSTAMGLGLRDEDTLAAQLQTRLNGGPRDPEDQRKMDLARTEPLWCVVNFGMGSQELWQEMLLLYEFLARGHRPDALLFYDGINETPGAMPWPTDDHATRSLYEHPASRWWRATKDVSGLVWAWRSVAYAKPERADVAADMDAMIERYALTVRLLRAMATELGVPVVFVWQPALAYDSGRTHRVGTVEEQAMLARFGKPEDAERHRAFVRHPPAGVHDLSPALNAVSEQVYMDPRHPNSAGTRIIADALMPVLAAEGIR